MSWVETESLSFVARHESEDADAVATLLDELEEFRAEMDGLFETSPGEVAVVFHGRPMLLALAQPWLPMARLAAAPAARRYFAGWFSSDEIHVLGPAALGRRAASIEGSHEALRLSALHEYAHVVIGANSSLFPPPFGVGSFRSYLRHAWVCEGAATFLAGQVPHLRAAVVRRLHEGPKPDFPPSRADAPLLGGTVFALLDREAGEEACVELVTTARDEPDRVTIERAFGRPAAAVERDWREYLGGLRAS